MNARDILKIYMPVSESLLNDIKHPTNIRNPVSLSSQYREAYIYPLRSYFEYKFKTIGAQLFDVKSYKVSAGVFTEIPGFKSLSEEEQLSLLNNRVSEFLNNFPKMPVKTYLGYDRCVNIEISIMPYGKSNSLIYQEFKESKRKLFTVVFSVPPLNYGIYCQIRFNAIVSYFSELMEIDIYHGKKTQRILADVTEEDFELFVINVKEVINQLVKAVRITMAA